LTPTFDIIILGAGTMGSAASYFLSKEKLRVLAIDQFSPPHEKGSHTGQSRIIRKAYFEHPDYVPLLNRAYENWRAVEFVFGKQLYHETGIAYFGRPNSEIIEGSRSSARLYNIPLVERSAQTYASSLQFSIPQDFQAFTEPEAGFLLPDVAITAFITLAKKNGVAFVTDQSVVEWKADQTGVTVKTQRDTYRAKKLIVTAGSWTSSLLLHYNIKLQVTKQLLAWAELSTPDRFNLGNFPCWFIDDPNQGLFYGFPVLPFDKFSGPHGLKLALHVPGEKIQPDSLNDQVADRDRNTIESFLKKYLPEVKFKGLHLKHCMYTYSADSNFIIDFIPDTNNNAIVACGFSGHGFKFASVIGEILSDLACRGKTNLPIDFLRMR